MSLDAYVKTGCAVVLAIGVYYLFPGTPPPPTVVANFGKNPCDDAWQHDVAQPPVNHFKVKFTEGCFDGVLRLPKWREWHYQPVGNDSGWWVSFWFEGDRDPTGIFDRYARPYFAHRPMAFRLQGKKGQEILFYTSDATPEASREKPADGAAPGVVTDATLIRQEQAECTPEAREAKFSGSATVSFFINEHGLVEDARIDRSTGIPSLDEEMLKTAGKFWFTPAQQNGKPVKIGRLPFEIRLKEPCK